MQASYAHDFIKHKMCAGLAFAGVHDSFWTHPGDVDRMNAILRDAFVELHSRPLLEELKAEFEAMFPGLVFPEVPNRVRAADCSLFPACQRGRCMFRLAFATAQSCWLPTLGVPAFRRAHWIWTACGSRITSSADVVTTFWACCCCCSDHP